MEFKISFPGGKKVDADTGSFTIKTDQSQRSGGEGSAPEPFALFLASLGTCAGIYVLSFCKSRDISTKGVELVQRHLADPSTGKLGRIELDIRVPESFPEKYHNALVRAASQCAVKKMLENPPEIVTQTVVF